MFSPEESLEQGEITATLRACHLKLRCIEISSLNKSPVFSVPKGNENESLDTFKMETEKYLKDRGIEGDGEMVQKRS